jgi:hypothetical protein
MKTLERITLLSIGAGLTVLGSYTAQIRISTDLADAHWLIYWIVQTLVTVVLLAGGWIASWSVEK